MLKPFIGAACLCAAAISPAQAQTVRESTSAARQAFMVVKVHDALNVRSGPSVRFGVINTFQSGTRVAITGDCRSMWCPVQHESTSGWVYRSYLTSEVTAARPSSPPGNPSAQNPSRPNLATPQRPAKETEAKKMTPAQAAFAFFLEQGWVEHQAAGIVGNLQAECGYALNCSIHSGGIAQWRAERVTRFRHVFGYPLLKATFNDQLAYIQWELTHPKSPWRDSGRILRSAKDAVSAAVLFDVHYEKSSGGTRGARIANARAILKKYGGGPS